MLSSCCCGRKKRQGDHEPLLPRYRDDTVLQRELHQKMHTYQMLRAMTQGYMPSNEQVIVNLRTLIASDILNPENPELSDSGRRLVRQIKQWLHEFIDLLLHKNGNDAIQDFLWFLLRSRISLEADRLARHGPQSKIKKDVAAAYESVRTVGSLLLTNSDFRLFLGDMGTVGRQVFADTARSLRDTADQAAALVEPSKTEAATLAGPGADQGPAPSEPELKKEVDEIATVVTDGLAQTTADATASLSDNLSGDQRATVINRLKQAVTKLRKRPDYYDSVSTIGLLVQRYLTAYTRPVEEAVDAVQEDIHTNDEVDKAAQNFWELITSFGNVDEWKKTEQQLRQVMRHSEEHPEVESLVADVGTATQQMLQDPEFWDSAEEKFGELQTRSRQVRERSTIQKDVDDLLAQMRKTFRSVLRDLDVARLISTTSKIASILSPIGASINAELIKDGLNIFIPLAIQAIQYIPILRLEMATPKLDLLLENLIIEPGKTVNHSSFLPYKLKITTQNEVEVRKARFRATSSVSTLVSIKLDGLSIRAEEVGYWLRMHSGLLRFMDEGIASFELDERGIDIHVDVEVGANLLDSAISLRDVKVHIHHLDYKLRKSRVALLAWLFKPILRPLLARSIEKHAAEALAGLFRTANRELLFARERLRATRIADPHDLATFLRAVLSRLVPAPDPDIETAVGVTPSIFRGVYAPGSLVKQWEEEARQAEERVEDYAADGWRNGIFDVPVA